MRPLRTLLVGLLAVLALALVACGGSSSGSGSKPQTGTQSGPKTAQLDLNPAFGSMNHLPGVQTGPPPWTNGAVALRARLKAIGLPALTAEGTVLHTHQHLDVYVRGQQVPIAAGIGIDPGQQFISELHTHDPSGIIHVESPTQAGFSLGQFFAVWGVRLGPGVLGGLKAGNGNVLKAWVNGKPVTADPTRIPLEAHEEIVLAYGTPAQMPKSPPSSYAFPQGL